MRELDHAYINKVISRRREWRGTQQQRITKHLGNIPFMPRHNEITDQVVQNLHDIADVLIAHSDCKLVVSTDYAWVYTNDVQLIDQLASTRVLSSKTYTQAVVNRPANTIRLKNSAHGYRSYFKITKLTAEQKDTLINFLLNQPTARISPALTVFFQGSFHRTQDYFFVDHADMTWLTMLALVNPSLIRKTVKIIPTK